jgi:RNA polymerase sigma-70 factor (ECF subfamily)
MNGPDIVADASGSTGEPMLGALIGGCARREQHSFRALYECVAPQLLACLVRILRDRDRAEEALQDVFVQIWQRAHQFDPTRGEPLAWLVSMARYRAIDLLRGQRPVRAFEEGEAEQLAGPSTADPSESVTFAREASAFTRCFGLLSEDQRRCIKLAYLDGQSHEEVARATKRALGSVKSWIRRGLESLRECLST